MIEKVIENIEQNQMFNYGDKVVVGFSGGPDSACLVHVLHTLKERLGIEVIAAHVNHCLRGEEADRDEQYVEEFCKKIGIQCYIKREDIHKVSKENGISCEMAGREIRYEFFQEVLKKVDGQKIAIAHNANDQAETVLMRMMRGAGLEGLVGIKAVRDDIYVRPILTIDRKEIEEYCEVNNLNPRIDKTNLENIFARNKVRLELIPYIQDNFNKDIIESLNRMAETIKTDNDYINEMVRNCFSEYCTKEKGKIVISKNAFLQHEAILTRIIRVALGYVKGDLRNFEKVHIYDIINLQKHSTGKRIMLPGNVEALNNYGSINLYIKKQREPLENKSYILDIDKVNDICEAGIEVDMQKHIVQKSFQFTKNNLIKYFDYDKINSYISLRFRKNGDKFSPLGMKGSKKLKDLFMDLKIPKDERDNIPLICFGDDIAWIVGYRVSEKFKVDENTKNILQIKIKREGE